MDPSYLTFHNSPLIQRYKHNVSLQIFTIKSLQNIPPAAMSLLLFIRCQAMYIYEENLVT